MIGTEAVSFLKRRFATGSRDRSSAGYPIRGYVKRAVLWSIAFGIAHLVGLRAYTSILSGTVVPEKTHVFLGMVYMVLYLGVVFLVPTLLIAAGILKGVTLVRAVRSR